MKILVVDDERDVKLLFEQRFRREIRAGAIEFVFAFSGEEALAMLSGDGNADVVLILSDINMPGMTGLELLRQVKQSTPDLPVMMITAYGDDETRAKAMQFGADDFLTKPLDFSSLKSQIIDKTAGGVE